MTYDGLVLSANPSFNSAFTLDNDNARRHQFRAGTWEIKIGRVSTISEPVFASEMSKSKFTEIARLQSENSEEKLPGFDLNVNIRTELKA